MGAMSILGGVLGVLIIGSVLLLDARMKNSQGTAKGAGLGGWASWKNMLGREAALQRARDRIIGPEPTRTQRRQGALSQIDRQRQRGISDEELICYFGAPADKPKQHLFTQLEDGSLVYGPARSGKSRGFVMRRVAHAPGVVVSTSTKVDVIRDVLSARQPKGDVWVYDPQNLLPETFAVKRLRWNPLVGCDDPEVAIRRAEAWAGAQPMSGVKGGDWWNRRGAELLAKLLHAAALRPDLTVLDVKRWGGNLTNKEPRMILDADGPQGWAADLSALAENKAGETVGSVQMSLAAIMDCLTSPRTALTLTPERGDHFDVRAFLDGRNTLFLLASDQAGETVAPLFAMLVDEVIHEASELSQSHEHGFLWPPLRVVGDELPQLAPLQKLPAYVADSGGRGIQLDVIAQSRAAVVQRWGEEGAESIETNSALRLYLPGVREEKVHRNLIRLGGQKTVRSTTISHQENGGGSSSRSTRKEDRLTPEMVRELNLGEAWMEYRALRIGKVKLPVWTGGDR